MARRLDNWLSEYLEYCRNTEPPESYHTWTGIAVVAAALKRKCWLNWGTQGKIFPNFYIALVGPPGGRKGTAMKIGKSMLIDIDIPLGSDCITRAALVQEFESVQENFVDTDGIDHVHSSLSVFSEEFVVFLGEQNPDMVITLTDLFDCPRVWRYTTKNKGKSNLENVWLNLIGAITPSLLHNKVTLEAIGGGLMSRTIFVVEQGKSKLVPHPFLTKDEELLYEHLLSDLGEIATLQGPFKMTEECLLTYQQWYLKGIEAVNDPKFDGYNERRSLHARKLAMIMSACRTNDMIINVEDWERGLGLLELVEPKMHLAFAGIGKAEHSKVMHDVMAYIAVTHEASWKEILSRFRYDVLADDLTSIMKVLREIGVVTEHGVGSNRSYKYIKPDKDEEDME